MSGHTGKVDDDAALVVSHEEAFPLWFWVLCVDGIGDMSVDHEGADSLLP